MTPNWVFLVFITMFGACVGSFLNVVIYRLPAGLSLVTPPSRCPHCEHKLATYENVPVLGWLWLRGKCRKCKAPISIQYPLIEALTAAIFAGCFVLFYLVDGWRRPLGSVGFEFVETWPVFVVWVVMLAGLLAATLIDARHYIIPLQIPWTISVVALIGLPLGVAFGKPPAGALGQSIGFEPFVPYVGQTGAMIAWGGAAGLLIANVLLWFGVLPDSFEGEVEDALDEDGEVPPLKHPRRVALKELMFVGFPLLGMLVGHFLAVRGVIDQPAAGQSPWYYALAGCVLGFLVGGGMIWMIRILGTLGFGKEAMGLGDVHLLAAIGAVLGWHESVFLCIFISPFLGLAVTLVLAVVAAAKKGPARVIPYGPYLAAGAVVVLLVGFGENRISDNGIDVIHLYDHFTADPIRGTKQLFVP
jgi:leader peptidase (prepilin peptidase)/N-methyltransferase